MMSYGNGEYGTTSDILTSTLIHNLTLKNEGNSGTLVTSFMSQTNTLS